MSTRKRMLDRWDSFVRNWLRGDDGLPHPLDAWWAGYSASGEGAPTRAAMAEPYIGDWENPQFVTLGLNPGAAELSFQGRGGYFAEQVRSSSYREWAGTDPYGSDLWEAENTVNRPRKSGRRVNPHREQRLRFARRWLSDPALQGRELLMVELYPWHSRAVKGVIKPPSSVLDEFVWAPIGDLAVDTVFAFGKPWVAAANALGLEEQVRWGAATFTSPVREAAAYWLPGGRQRLVVVWQSAYAGPPGPADTDRLHELLGE